jgi:hypothetical protein
MSTVSLYGFESAEGEEDTFNTFSADEAKEYAQKHGLKWIAYEYEYSDSEMVMDFTPQDDEEDQPTP